MALRPAFRRDNAGETRGLDQRGIGRAQILRGEDAALGKCCEAAEGLAGEVAQHAAAKLAHFLSAAVASGAVRPWLGEGRLGLRFRLGMHGGFRAEQILLHAGLDAAQQPGGAEHVQVHIHHRRDFRLGILRQRCQTVLQLLQLVARARHSLLQPRQLWRDLGGGEFFSGDDEVRLCGLVDRTNADARRDRMAGEALFPAPSLFH